MNAFNNPNAKEKVMRTVHVLALILVLVGALNWGLVGLAQFDLVAALFGGPAAPLSRVVYSLVGIAAIVVAATSFLPAPHRADMGPSRI
jgi:uncharacterized membrane protein YuzA (DUF378 family)